MSKIGDWVLAMQEDAPELTREEFIEKYGETNVHVWDYIHHPEDYYVNDHYCRDSVH